MKQLPFAAALTVMTTAGIALALNNEDKTIARVDTQGSLLIITLDQAHSSSLPASCNTNTTSTACDLNDLYCEMAGKIALAAQMSGKPVDYDLSSTTCVGSFGKFTRFRVQN
jgi:hypothetical protein